MFSVAELHLQVCPFVVESFGEFESGKLFLSRTVLLQSFTNSIWNTEIKADVEMRLVLW